MADDATIRLDQGGVNARILAKEAKVDFRRVESASRKIATTFCSPEVKRLFVRYFNSMQLNMYLISVTARTKLPHAMVEQIEGALKAQLEKLHAELNEAIDGAEALCKTHGITRLATYDTEPLALEVKVISPFGRRYLELMTNVDRLMPMLETLAIDEVIEVNQLDLQKAMAKKAVRRVAGAARNFASGLRQRMNGIAPGDPTRKDSDASNEGGGAAGIADTRGDVPTQRYEFTGRAADRAIDRPIDSVATGEAPGAKPKTPVLTLPNGASQRAATA